MEEQTNEREQERGWRFADLLERYTPRPVARLVSWARSDESLSTAASLAFFALVSLPPMAVIALWLTSLLVGDQQVDTLGERITSLLPAQLAAEGTIGGLVEAATSMGWTSILGALWPATAYGAGLARAFERLTPSGRRRMTGLRGRVLVVVVIALLPVLTLAALLAVLFMPGILGEEPAIRLLGLLIGAALAVLAVTLVTALLYGLFSPSAVTPKDALRGATWTGGAITAVSIGYVLYLRVGANFEDRYGSSTLAAVILLALWLYLANGALVVGYKRSLMSADGPAWGDREEAAR